MLNIKHLNFNQTKETFSHSQTSQFQVHPEFESNMYYFIFLSFLVSEYP